MQNRARLGPARWPHHDLLWIHHGRAEITLGATRKRITLNAPDGILIMPHCPFEGRIQSSRSTVSITHFRKTKFSSKCEGDYIAPDPKHRFILQTMLELSHSYAQHGEADAIRLVLLEAILDAFTSNLPPRVVKSRVQAAWGAAAANLSGIRTLADVAAMSQLSESAFRAIYRNETGTSAGVALTDLRITTAEKLLMSSSMSIKQIASQVGYGSPESLTRAFLRLRKISPTEYRKTKEPFA